MYQFTGGKEWKAKHIEEIVPEVNKTLRVTENHFKVCGR